MDGCSVGVILEDGSELGTLEGFTEILGRVDGPGEGLILKEGTTLGVYVGTNDLVGSRDFAKVGFAVMIVGFSDLVREGVMDG